MLRIVNLTNPAAWRALVVELYAIAPLQVRVKLPGAARATAVKLLVSGGAAPAAVRNGWAAFEIRSILDHDVAVIG